MSNQVVLKVDNIKKSFFLPHGQSNSLKESITQVFKPKKKGGDTYHALNGISFEVRKGDFFGVVGRNGAGKSTLLRILAEIYQPTTGKVWHHGKLVPFIELGVGFNDSLTARQNVYLNGAMLGFSKKEMDARYDSIVEFAELEKFMDQKLKNFSSGMRVRLAFSVAIQADADILLLDEVLAVGDTAFKRKCFDYFNTLKESKKTIIFVSHGMNAIRDYCNRAILIEDGKVAYEGSADEIADRYMELFDDGTVLKESIHHETRGGKNKPSKMYLEDFKLSISKNKIKVESTIGCSADQVTYAKFNVLFKDKKGNVVAGLDNINSDNGKPIGLHPGNSRLIAYEINNILMERDYTVSASLVSDADEVYDQWDDITHFTNDYTEEGLYPVKAPGKLMFK